MTTQVREAEWLKVAQTTLEIEAKAIEAASTRLDGNLTRAIDILLNSTGKVMISGIGKSGHIAQKIAATFCSTGTPSVFMHATDAIHGDLGVYTPGDPTILISNSGTTAELVNLIPILRQFKSPLIAIVGKLNSVLSREADVVLDSSVAIEADPLGIVPTSSAIVALALGDALAAALMQARGFTEQDFIRFHPGGQLGRNLWLHVSDVMHRAKEVAWVSPETSLKEVVIAMTQHPLGATCVVDDEFHLLGFITDGDVRRALQVYDDIRSLHAKDVMTTRPVSILANATLKQAVHLMEDRPHQISVLPVQDPESNCCLGLIRIHDIYQVNLK
jgi:arabinose-5-phosphate isomerase